MSTELTTKEDNVKLVTISIPFIEGLSQEIRRIARSAGVRCAFMMPNKMGFLYSNKDRLQPSTATHIVYSVKCKCDEEYIGETKRAAETRMKEHKDAIRLAHTEKSAIAQHVHEQAEPHDIDWQSWSVIDRARGQTERKVREALHIKLRKPGLNRDKGAEYSTTWHAIL